MSLRAAVNAKCRWCIHDELAPGSAAVQVELCAAVDCPLWPVRPIRAQRIPYSPSVVAEYGMTEREADARLREPRNPAVFACTTPNRQRAGEGGVIPGERAPGNGDAARAPSTTTETESTP